MPGANYFDLKLEAYQRGIVTTCLFGTSCVDRARTHDMAPPLRSLVEYDTPSLVSTSKSKAAKDGKVGKKVGKIGCCCGDSCWACCSCA